MSLRRKLMLKAGGYDLYEPDAAAYAAAVQAAGAPITARRVKLLGELITASKACGHWDATDDIALLAAENPAQALTTLKRRVLMTAVNDPPFTADQGYAFDGTTQYIDTNRLMSDRTESGANERLSVYERTNVAATTQALGYDNAGANAGFVIPRSASSLLRASALSNPANGSDSVTDSRGYTVVAKVENSTSITNYKNGVAGTSFTASSVSTTRPAFTMFVGATNNGGSPAGRRASTIGLVDWGLPIGATAEAEWYTAVQAFMTAIGANV